MASFVEKDDGRIYPQDESPCLACGTILLKLGESADAKEFFEKNAAHFTFPLPTCA